jgi:hypothetical protein
MAGNPWLVPIQELMLKDASKRAEHYRDQAVRLREMGEGEPNEKLRAEMQELANKYDQLAQQISGRSRFGA